MVQPMRGDRTWMVEFYAPWCPHCQELAPLWQETALAAKVRGWGVIVASVDCVANGSELRGGCGRTCLCRCARALLSAARRAVRSIWRAQLPNHSPVSERSVRSRSRARARAFSAAAPLTPALPPAPVAPRAVCAQLLATSLVDEARLKESVGKVYSFDGTRSFEAFEKFATQAPTQSPSDFPPPLTPADGRSVDSYLMAAKVRAAPPGRERRARSRSARRTLCM